VDHQRRGFNRTLPPAGNVFLNGSDKFGRNRTQDGPSPRQEQGHVWKPDTSGFKPSTWPDQQNRQVLTEYPWNAGKDQAALFGRFGHKYLSIFIHEAMLV